MKKTKKGLNELSSQELHELAEDTTLEDLSPSQKEALRGVIEQRLGGTHVFFFDDGLKPEEKARKGIDRLLEHAGWCLQDHQDRNVNAALGVAVREHPMTTGFADYLLFIGGKAVGVIEAKAQGHTLSGVAEQSTKYAAGFPIEAETIAHPLPFAYESTGVDTQFRDLRDPDPRSRWIFAFHRPETLQNWLGQTKTLRARLLDLPQLQTEGLQKPLRQCQIEAIDGLEESFRLNRPRALLQMSTGSGKTFCAISFIYRLIKFGKASRVLFLVDRTNLGDQTLKEFQAFTPPDDNRAFHKIYNVQHLASNKIDNASKVCISTVQRLYSMLRGEALTDAELEEQSAFENDSVDTEPPKEVVYAPHIPIETFDFIIVDECHRSIYNLWRGVLEYFDAFLIGLTATPSKQTFGFFNQNLVVEYGHERAVADHVNVNYDVFRIRTKITEQGGTIESGFQVGRRNRANRKTRWEQADQDIEYSSGDLDKAVVSKSQIRKVLQTFKDKLFAEIYPERTVVPKTLIFAKDDSHAEDIVEMVKEVFDKGDDFCKKITYRVTGIKPKELIKSFCNSDKFRVAVTVDMVSTGTDIKPLEIVFFMRQINSRVYFEQMKGRGTRTIAPSDLQMVTPDAPFKDHFVIIDAVGVCDNDKTDSRPLERKRSISFDKLIDLVGSGNREDDNLLSLASRLARLTEKVKPKDRTSIEEASGGLSVEDMVNRLLDVDDQDRIEEKARELFSLVESIEDFSEDQLEQAKLSTVEEAAKPFESKKLRELLKEIKGRREQIIDETSEDELLFAEFDEGAKKRAEGVIQSFKQFMEDNKDEITALQVFYNQSYGQRHLTFEMIKELSEALERRPLMLTTDKLWQAYARLEKSRVRKASPQKLLTDLVSLVRYSLGEVDVLEPFTAKVDERFQQWLERQQQVGREFSQEQLDWLAMIKEHITTSLGIDLDDFEYAPFHDKGGPFKVMQLFGEDLDELLDELNKELVA